ASGSNHSLGTADVLVDPNSRISGVLTTGQAGWYRLTVPQAGRLTASATAEGNRTLVPRLALSGPSGNLLGQSGGGTIVQYLQPGAYYLTVSATSGSGVYQLTSRFAQSDSPINSTRVGAFASSVLVADVNGDGKPDLIIFNKPSG